MIIGSHVIVQDTTIIKYTMEDYALYLLKMTKDYIKHDCSNKTIYFWNEEESLWMSRDIENIRTYITKILIPYANTNPDHDIATKHYHMLKQNSKQMVILRICKPYIKSQCDDEFIRTYFNRKKGFLPIADNKVINLQTGEIRVRVREDYFTKTTTSCITQLTTERREFVLNYFSQILTKYNESKASDKYRDSLMFFIAYIFTNENHLKIIGHIFGSMDVGRTVFITLLRNMLGGLGGGSVSRLFVGKKTDEWFYNLRGKHMVCMYPIPKKKYNEDQILKISGGIIRDKNTIFSCVLVLETDNVYEFSDPELIKRLRCFNFCNLFQRDDSVKKDILSRVDDFFTVICEYAKIFYENDRKINWSDEVKTY